MLIGIARTMPFDPGVLLMLGVTAALAGVAVLAAIPVLMPLFRRYAMARPSARGSHKVPTPQGGGAPIIAAVVLLAGAAGLAGVFSGIQIEIRRYYTLVLFGSVALALLGAADDIRPMTALKRFIIQIIVASVAVFAAPAEWQIVGALPQAIERMVLVVGFVWMINLTNFMDGIDGIVAMEVIPLGIVLALIAAAGLVSVEAGFVAAALAGAAGGFYRFNRHPAQLFMGDVGSLSIGFIVAALLFELAATRSLAAALILPLYFLIDATSTLLAGIWQRIDVTKPHRRHAYQRAVDTGWSAPQVTRAVLVLNLSLGVLAVAAVSIDASIADWLAFFVAAGGALYLTRRFRAGGA